ncbi:hypothetical protein PHLCEN_2v273 [Hermanssonia centrifuga]|uniref:Uncharacterized protein n=1 Tax=Hermanssonia centrifuga TaxID=98765 RepID=A0A2R6S6B8_9APHY|nr:hypothetical protein PHLCEN_2v273 [Hermanssonia centrifuga]
MPEEFASHLVPIIETHATAPLIKEDSDEIGSNSSCITFLPLPSSFDYNKQSSWAALASEIQGWLLALAVSPKSPERSWATDCFWMAYLAAFPDFPRGQWTLWDPRINICETFAERWTMTPTGNFAIRDSVEHDETCSDSCDACIQSRRELWEEFTRHASLFYVDGPLVRQA